MDGEYGKLVSEAMVSRAVRRRVAAILVTAAAITAVSCADTDDRPMIAVGADASTESVVLAEIYAQALARVGTRTSVVTGLTDPMAALDAGRVSVLGARNGALLDRWNPTSPAREPAAVNAAVNAALPPGLTVSDAADGTDLRAQFVRTDTAVAADGLRTVTDLAPHCATMTIGSLDPAPDLVAGCAPAQLLPSPDLPTLRANLLDNHLQAGITAGPGGDRTGLITLPDPEYAIRAQNTLALYRSGIFDRAQIKKLNYVAGELTTEALLDLITQVDSGTTPTTAARLWLDAHAL
ncbi:glycine betaine ABC transporter substrate-binding protein [Nocardia sp. AG03]|uniref:glycine betaine ABC transporter substrate-binding protein n=1 Tax=Nocardia sp. AG03 TaxID=3025312 RepID=UPI0024188500|nr:glycine betaine ABC transporter substrate-binding protein [Nocardia sp. AG03]